MASASSSIPRRLAVTAALAAVGVLVLYLVFVRTHWGQEVDDAAFEGRSVTRPELTAETDRLLQSVTRESLAVLGGALLLVALGGGGCAWPSPSGRPSPDRCSPQRC